MCETQPYALNQGCISASSLRCSRKEKKTTNQPVLVEPHRVSAETLMRDSGDSPVISIHYGNERKTREVRDVGLPLANRASWFERAPRGAPVCVSLCTRWDTPPSWRSRTLDLSTSSAQRSAHRENGTIRSWPRGLGGSDYLREMAFFDVRSAVVVEEIIFALQTFSQA